MKAIRLFCVLIVCTIYSSIINAQVEIDVEKKVGISTLPLDDIKLALSNLDQPTSLKIISDYDGSDVVSGIDFELSSSTSAKVYGFKNSFDLSSGSQMYGMFNEFESSGSGKIYGLYNVFKEDGGSEKTGVYNDIKQTTGANKSYGIFSKISAGGTGLTYGLYNLLSGDGVGVKYGVYNNVTQGGLGFVYGTYNRVVQNANKFAYGAYTKLDGNGIGNKYGVNSIVAQSPSNSGTSVGFYADITPGTGVGTGVRVLVKEGGNAENRGVDLELKANSNSTKNATGIRSLVDYNGSGNNIKGYYNEVEISGTADPNFTYGVHNVIIPSGNNTKTIFGSKTEVDDANNTSGVIYGSHIDLNNTSDRYGIYVNVNGFDGGEEPAEAVNPDNVYAAYFEGDMFHSGATHTMSDAKFKKDIKDVSGMLSKVMSLNSKSYKFNNRESNVKEFGFLAQELEIIFPELVKDIKAPPKFIKSIDKVKVENPETGKYETIEEVVYKEESREEFKAVNYDGLIPILVQAMQEQQGQIEELKKEIKILKGSNTKK